VSNLHGAWNKLHLLLKQVFAFVVIAAVDVIVAVFFYYYCCWSCLYIFLFYMANNILMASVVSRCIFHVFPVDLRFESARSSFVLFFIYFKANWTGLVLRHSNSPIATGCGLWTIGALLMRRQRAKVVITY